MADRAVYGLLAEFDGPETLVQAAHATRSAGYRAIDAFAPFPVPGLAEALGFRERIIAPTALVCGIAGATLALALQWYSAVVDYPYVVGGKPLASWPAFLPITFEAGIIATVMSLLVMLVLNRLPQPYHPVFNDIGFERASDDSFFLLIKSVGDNPGVAETRTFLESQGAMAVREVSP